MKTTIITTYEYDFSIEHVKTILLNHLVKNEALTVTAEDVKVIKIDRDRIKVAVNKKEYKKGF